ncbi:hypothetical protein [Clostridium tertium]|uniref:hypothetical protein n=1 Tax=Clostridium tertium TaxID=1559 RepID=UPI001290305F|nr:hypothetical protein [Clostridium tertium]
MRKDIQNKLNQYTKEAVEFLNKSELARRFNCDPRTIDRHIKLSSGELLGKKSQRSYHRVLDDYTSIIIDKVDVFGATAMAVYKFIQKKDYEGKYSTVAAFIKELKLRKPLLDLKLRLGCKLKLTGKKTLL